MSDGTDAATREISFSCKAPEAERVFLAGTFNAWDPTATAMQRDSSGTWFLLLDLAPGAYEYKFVLDGEWCCEAGSGEPAECGRTCVANAFGTMNSVITVD
ncbi:MAG: glycogen-binding domain-containing protein [Acidobacteria bacterium]|nr:glycogen-binding domain-containing protein [Acidobacteriota bacterium]